MYHPSIDHRIVKALYRIKKFYKKPITKLANELIKKSLNTISKEDVCATCIVEGNQECEVCILAHL